jgi:asparagine synthase (glutamine-hydrolysing)
MCGIAGYLSLTTPFNGVNDQAFHGPLKFRGPDHTGIREINQAALSGKLFHYRLSIIDLDSRSHQPMKSGSGKSEIVFNGEIYNYRALKSELMLAGIQFITNSDTEVILAGYEIWGMEKLLDKLDGMFAFTLVDFEAQSIFLARDPFGKKPLYYYWNPAEKKLVFSSDIRSFEHFPITLTLNENALAYYFCELSTPEHLSIYTGVAKIHPGSFHQFNMKGEKITSYFTPDYRTKVKISRTEILEESERLLENAVKKRMLSDVGVSAFLSGGIDSSLVVALMAKNSAKPINTYTVGYSDQRFDESGFARKVAQKWNTNHTEILLDELSTAEIQQIFEECGEPFADSSILPSAIICKAISKHEKVALSGDGGDEIFGGYYEYYFASRLDKYRAKKPLLKVLQALYKAGIRTSKTKFANELFTYGFNLPEPMLLHRNNMGFHPDEVSRLLHTSNPVISEEFDRIWKLVGSRADSVLGRVMSGSLHTRLVNDYLVKVDRASMMHSLEVRSPFLDKDLVKFAVQIPDTELIHQGIPKSITKDIAQKYLPKEDINRTKMGFGVPIGDWFKTRMKAELDQAVHAMPASMDRALIQNYVTRHRNGENHTDKMVTLYAFYLWNKRRVQ